MKKLAAAVALVAVASSVASAQTDFGSPIGAGGGVGGAVAPLGVPSGNGGGTRSGVSPTNLNTARSEFVGATGGVTVPNPAGGSVIVPQPAAAALGGVLTGAPSAAQQTTLTAALGGGVTAGALTSALQAMGSSPTLATVQNAVTAFNALINSLPAGETPSATVLAARMAIAAAMGQ
jgi:hypothetical protein